MDFFEASRRAFSLRRRPWANVPGIGRSIVNFQHPDATAIEASSSLESDFAGGKMTVPGGSRTAPTTNVGLFS